MGGRPRQERQGGERDKEAAERKQELLKRGEMARWERRENGQIRSPGEARSGQAEPAKGTGPSLSRLTVYFSLGHGDQLPDYTDQASAGCRPQSGTPDCEGLDGAGSWGLENCKPSVFPALLLCDSRQPLGPLLCSDCLI